MKIIFDYNRTLFDPMQNTLYFGVIDMLAVLSVQHELYLVSKNELRRSETVKELGIEKYFKKIVFIEEKSTAVFKELVGDSNDVLVVGDRIQGEIYLGNMLGFITIWIQQGKFSSELPQSKEYEPNCRCTSIPELLEIIKQYE